MKKRATLLLLPLLVAVSASAQFTFGIKGGYNLSLGFDENWNFNSHTIATTCGTGNGYKLGIMTRAGGRAYMQIEALFAQKYATYIVDGQSARLKHQTIDMPILAGFKLIDKYSFKWRIMAGPSFSFNAGSKYNLTTERVDIGLRDYEVGMDIGTGLDIGMVTIDLRYQLIQNSLRFKVGDKKLNKNPVNAFELSLGVKLFDYAR